MKKTILILLVLLFIGIGIYFLTRSNKDKSNGQSNLTNTSQVAGVQSDTIIKSDSYFVGPSDAKVVIVEFSDFQCPACQYYSKEIEQVAANYPDKVKIVFRNFPLTYHENALPSALAAEAAGKQGKYYQMNKLLFAEQKLSEQDLIAYAKQLGLDMDKFNADRKSQEILDKINRDYQDGVATGLQGTPAFYLNGEEVKFNPIFTNWKIEIEKILEK